MSRIFSFTSTTAAGFAVCLMGPVPASAETNPVLPEEDAELVEEASQDSMEYSKTFETTEWVNPDTGNRGRITPTETYQTEDGTYCREFHQTVTIGGEEVEAYGTACRQPDGTWEIARRTPDEELGLEPEPEPVEVVEEEPEVVYRDRVVYVRDRYRYRDWWYPWAYPVGVSIGFGIHDGWWHHRGHYTKHHHRGHHRHGYYGGHRGGHHRWHRGGTYRSRW